MKQNENLFFFSHAVGRFSLEDEMEELNEKLINLSLDLEKKNIGVVKIWKVSGEQARKLPVHRPHVVPDVGAVQKGHFCKDNNNEYKIYIEVN